MTPRADRVWIVERWNPDKKRWEPTTGAALCWDDGRNDLRWWNNSNPDDRYRLVPYQRVRRNR